MVVLITSFTRIRNYNVEKDKYLLQNLYQFQDICKHVYFDMKKMRLLEEILLCQNSSDTIDKKVWRNLYFVKFELIWMDGMIGDRETRILLNLIRSIFVVMSLMFTEICSIEIKVDCS